jgi:methylphosphotriester-DNA--protein-cysteine methyltransferase
MWLHSDLASGNFARSRQLQNLMAAAAVTLAGNKRLKIYGTLQCKSGKRLTPDNRVLFGAKIEAVEYGYRPCGHCLKEEYKKWKNEFVR